MKHLSKMLLLPLGFVCGSAMAAEPAYLDDRSDAASLVRSFYNAINRHEYSRAWDYFGQTKPSASYEAFVKGFETIERIEVATGAISVEGAAGSQIFTVPVAIAAFGRSGSEKVFSGCYTMRLADPRIQDPPFVWLHIEEARMAVAQQPYTKQLPASCGDGPPAEPRDADLDGAREQFAAAHESDCPAGTSRDAPDPDLYSIAFRPVDAQAADPDVNARLMRFICNPGAENATHYYYLATPGSGVAAISFAAPELDIHYLGNGGNRNVESIGVIGFNTLTALPNSTFDEATQSIVSASKWREAGDASSSGTWLFRNGAFTLVHYEVDASYDGDVNPQSVIDYNSAP